jgi:hypothetical protein
MVKLPKREAHNIGGFALQNALPDQVVAIEVRGMALSDDARFHNYLKHVSAVFLHPNKIRPERVTHFVIVVHDDWSADIYVNDEITLLLEISAKKAVNAGQEITVNDIADIRRLQIANITLKPTDKVVVCIKVGWKYGVLFDLGRPDPLDVPTLETDLGKIYRRLSFEHVYRAIESEALAGRLFGDGWFPFVELLGTEYDLISEAYRADFNIDGTIQKVLDGFSVDRVNAIGARWWVNPLFAEHRQILEAGIEAYNQHATGGYITCIKTLGTEIEGILRRKAADDTGGLVGKVREWIAHLAGTTRLKVEIDDSLLLPEMFCIHLEQRVFAHFELDNAGRPKDNTAGRHSVSHGAATPSAYTRARAFQMILILDQIFFHTA